MVYALLALTNDKNADGRLSMIVNHVATSGQSFDRSKRYHTKSPLVGIDVKAVLVIDISAVGLYGT